MFIVTGGAGFIGSALVSKLNSMGITDILIVDSLGKSEKWKNLVGKSYLDYIHKEDFIEQIRTGEFPYTPQCVYHFGACSSTTQEDAEYLMSNNFHYARDLAHWALENNIRFIYASSAATYGNGNKFVPENVKTEKIEFSDNEAYSIHLKPLNMYAYSKHIFDIWALRSGAYQKMLGLKLFNVYGPNEYHKGEQASMIFKAYHQILNTGKVKLFKSYRKDYQHGEQRRDFIYVKDVVDVVWQITHAPNVNGIFNLGTAKSRTWNELAIAVFKALSIKPNIEYVDMPHSLIKKYQYNTEATMGKLFQVGIKPFFTPLEEAVSDYVVNYLENDTATM